MLLKEVYNQAFINHLAEAILLVDKKFDLKNFFKNFSPKIWTEKELKQRMRTISLAINKSLSAKNFQQKIAVLKQVVVKISQDKNSQLALIIFADFVEVFGAEDFDFSMKALEFFTEFGSAEFAVRKFIKLDQKHALQFFKVWSKSKNHHVRRLACEGLRPRLPWGKSLTQFKKNPSEILTILKNLKFDESEYVRRSVANNLNDISKDHPNLVLQLLQEWQQEKVCEKLIKHALRTLLKSGNGRAFALIGIKNSKNLSENLTIESFVLEKTAIRISENLLFSFTLKNQVPNSKIRLEYAIYFLKKNGSHSKKIFQITTKNFTKNSFQFSKKHSFRDMTTRKHYAGNHLISLVANGFEFQKLSFDLV